MNIVEDGDRKKNKESKQKGGGEKNKKEKGKGKGMKKLSTHIVKESGGAETLLKSAECTLWILYAAGNE